MENNFCEMADIVKIIDLPEYLSKHLDSDSYCNFLIEKDAIFFTDKKIEVWKYESIEVFDYNACKKLYSNMHPNNYMVFIELWVKHGNGYNLSHFYFEATKDMCIKIVQQIQNYLEC